MKQVTIDAHDFDSMKEAKIYCKELMREIWCDRDDCRVRQTFRDDRYAPIRKRDDHKFLTALVRRHPNWKEKQQQIEDMGETITGFAVGKIAFKNGPLHLCFWLSTESKPKAVAFSADKWNCPGRT